MQPNTPAHLVINSNRWFSAVTDYSLQLTKFLGPRAILCAHPDSVLNDKVTQTEANFLQMPLLPVNPLNFLKSWIVLGKCLKENALVAVWVFEGREHTLCAAHRVFHRALWKETKLVRVRGQAQKLRTRGLSRIVYEKLTDKIVFAAQILTKNIPFQLNPSAVRTQLYCTDAKTGTAITAPILFIDRPHVPRIDFSLLTFLVVGRFDPVKGHEKLIETFARIDFAALGIHKPVQLILAGESKNVHAPDLHKACARALFRAGDNTDKRYFTADAADRKRIFIFDERLPSIANLMKSAHFGVIPSLGSEVICRVAVEFLQNGTPLISSDVGALPEVLDGAPAGIFAVDNMSEFSSCFRWAATAWQEKDSYHSMRSRCVDFAQERYSLSRFSDVVAWVVAPE